MSQKGMTWWTGTCRSRTAQDRLLNWIDSLAAGASSVRRYDQIIRGAINRDVFPTGDYRMQDNDFVREMEQLGVPVIRRRQTSLAIPRETYLRGIDFSPLHQHDANERLSFLFIESAELPQLNGRFVEIITPDELRQFNNPRLPHLNDGRPVWEIKTPFFDSSYFLADWLDQFLAWVASFYAEDLTYQRYPGFVPERLEDPIPESQTGENDGTAPPSAFQLYRENLRLAILIDGREKAEHEGFAYIYDQLQAERRKYNLDPK
jgi:hypothetical protein